MTTLVSRGEVTDRLYLVLDGEVRAQRSSNFGNLSLGQIRTGNLLGEAGYIDGKEYDFDAIAETDSDLLRLDLDRLVPVTDNDPKLAAALIWTSWKSLSPKLRDSNSRLKAFFGKTGSPPRDGIPITKDSDGEAFRAGIDAKRNLFREQQLSALEVNLLCTAARELHLKPHQVIFHDNDPGDAVYVVLSGLVVIHKYVPGAGDEAIAFLGRGNYFGEMALLDGQDRSAGAKADREGATVLSLPLEVVSDLVDAKKFSSLRLLKLFCSAAAQRLRESNDKLYNWFLLSEGQAPP
jgi:CRP-like cAMP-binding protein